MSPRMQVAGAQCPGLPVQRLTGAGALPCMALGGAGLHFYGILGPVAKIKRNEMF